MPLSIADKAGENSSRTDNGQGDNIVGNLSAASVRFDTGSATSSQPSVLEPKSSSSALLSRLCRRLLKAIGDPPVHIVLWNGEEIGAADKTPLARIIIRDQPTLRRLLLDPEFQFCEDYSLGRLEVEGGLRECLECIYRARLQSHSAGWLPGRLLSKFFHVKRSNSIGAARGNIHQHYDIGNEFYRLWLDNDLIYSCAYFTRENMTLEEAQRGKMDYVSRKLWLRPGESVVDVGGGWGGLALHMAKHYGVKVTAYNISRKQNQIARERAKAEGLDHQVRFVEDDYRNISGKFDALVSLGMLEHVGKGRYREFGRMADRCLAPHGRALIQTIGQSRPGKTNPWIERRIFPG
ncbi:MAG: class I SAM-dependent methyltransferase, partial [Thermoguttaceae bacterium]